MKSGDRIGSWSAGRGLVDAGDAEHRAAAGATRAWAVERCGPLGGRHAVETTITWRAYDVA